MFLAFKLFSEILPDSDSSYPVPGWSMGVLNSTRW